MQAEDRGEHVRDRAVEHIETGGLRALDDPAVAAMIPPPQKIATPPSMTLRRPRRSPRVPPASIRPANATMYPSTIH